MNEQILIISNSRDLHADLLIKKLIEMDENAFRINLDDFPKNYKINYSAHKNIDDIFEIENLSTHQSLTSSQVKSAWLRKSAEFSFISDDLAPQEKAFAKEQTLHLLQGFMNTLDCYWISHPSQLRASQWKLEQLIRAKKIGFEIPDSITTNCPVKAKQFYSNHHGKIITKTLSSALVGADQVQADEIVCTGVHTTMLTPEDSESLDLVKEIPCFFQAYIDKLFELRVTVVGDEVFCAKIDSQADERTKIDYRDFSAEIEYSEFSLPETVKQRCIDFVHSYGLEYGALDLIYTHQNTYVFLENNPVGQFWFIQQLVPELKILEHLAKCLSQGHR